MSSSPLNVIFCLPGSTFSNTFLESWSRLLLSLPQNNINPMMAPAQDSVVYYVRNKCLGGNNLRGIHQKPYDGKIPYDYLMWIDSDMVFNPESFYKLLSHGKDIMSGIYMMQGGRNYATCKNWDDAFFLKNGYFQFMDQKDIEGCTGPMEVDYTGFGFMLIKYGVFESMEYPWFQPLFHDLGDGIRDFSSEDVSFCKMVQKLGHKILIDPTVRVGHEKRVIY